MIASEPSRTGSAFTKIGRWRAWMMIYALRPTWVGGCRPLAMMPFLDPAIWKPKHQAQIVRFGIASEVLVAERA